MPVFSLRLPETLEADARAKAARLGISINALVCVAVDSYLHGVALQPVAEPYPYPFTSAHNDTRAR